MFKVKNKTFISMLAFLTVVCIIFILSFFNIYVFADDTINLVSIYDFDSTVLSGSSDVAFASSEDGSVQLFADLISDGKFTCPASYSSYLSDNPNFIIVGSSGNGTSPISFIPLPEHSFVISDSSSATKFTIFYYNPDENTGTIDGFNYYDYPQVGYTGVNTYSLTYDSFQTVDGVKYSVIPSGVISKDIILSADVPIYHTTDSYNDITSTSGLTDYNNLTEKESDENNMYLESASFVFSTYDYFSGSGSSITFNGLDDLKKGNVKFIAQLTDYQIADINTDDYHLKFEYTISANTRVSTPFGSWQNFQFSNSLLASVDLEAFYLQGCTYDMSFDYIVDYTNFDYYIQNYFGNDTLIFDTSYPYYFTLTADAYLINDNTNVTSGHLTNTLNFFDNQLSESASSITTNNNPYIDTGNGTMAGNGTGVIQTSKGSSSSGGNGTGVTVNFNDDDSSVINYVNGLIPNTDGDGGLSTELQNLTNSNRWLNFMKTALSFIPESFFDYLLIFFKASLGILIGAFVLRVILDVI